ncbi:MAG: hypothetical protein KC731_22390, partial [Myxococcales bacterium]|nr:hypothetical protein [Myxococcales bacterium]
REQLEEKLARAESADGWFGFRDLVVERRVEAGAEVVSLWLAPPDGRPLPPFAGGQYLTIAHRTDEEAVNDHRRAYAITNDPTAEAGYRITVRRRRGSGTEPPGLVSSHLYDAPVGARLRVAAPRGRLTLDALPGECPKLLLVSRGIGIAPMVSLVHHWARRGSPPEVRLLHEPIDGEPVPLLDELRAIEAAHPGFALRLVEPETLLPTALDEAAAEDARVFIAGSNAFVDRVEACLAARGVAPTRIHHERFGG